MARFWLVGTSLVYVTTCMVPAYMAIHQRIRSRRFARQLERKGEDTAEGTIANTASSETESLTCCGRTLELLESPLGVAVCSS